MNQRYMRLRKTIKRRYARNLKMRRWLLCMAVSFCLCGCEVGPDYQAPVTKMPAAFAGSPSGDEKKSINQPLIDASRWWQALNDPELNSLVERAVKSNLTLEIALDRMQEVRTSEVVVTGGALPQIGFSGATATGTGTDLTKGFADSALRAGDSTKSLSRINTVAGFDTDWELDLFGKYRRAMEASEYDADAAIAVRNDVLISVIADVARAYIDLRAEQMQLTVLKKNLDVAQQYLDFTQQRFDRGITNELDLTLAKREFATLLAEKMPLVSQIQSAKYVIAVLLGQFPEDLAKELETPGTIPALPENIASTLPVELLRRRPDIKEAERQTAAETARIGVAQADLFPHVSLIGSGGFEGQGFGVTPNPASFIWAAGPSVNWAVLDFGALDALVNVADLRSQEMLANYKQTVLHAVQQVDTSLGSYAAQQNRLVNLGQALDAGQRAVTLASERYNRGLTDSLNIVDAQRQEYQLENQYVSAQRDAGEQFVFLYKALGGGWENYQIFPPIKQPLPAVLAAFASLSATHGR